MYLESRMTRLPYVSGNFPFGFSNESSTFTVALRTEMSSWFSMKTSMESESEMLKLGRSSIKSVLTSLSIRKSAMPVLLM